jgi:hypothetical protein
VNLLQHFLAAAIRIYRVTVSPAQVYLFGATGGCRFTPSCSAYALDAIQHHGALAGGWLAVKRIARCQPWGSSGHDPVPQKLISQPSPGLNSLTEPTHSLHG